MSPIHPDLAPLARVAKTFSKVFRTTGQQGSGVLRSMSEANCYIVLEHERGKVEAGELVQVQLFEGLT